ncbi:MAG: carbohydrate kinase [Alphaproteobacteria bacterium]|nr:carbohydrate kinase [Alphaproteobacteria bacterium]MDE2112441.1 carbohydrate kinase [Alphaproteobacteria bacterium]MDE2494056.1 carbohydrate kinase [Alphaproteobacteria bacterium]
MRHGCIVVLDVGKTLAKVTMWSREGRLLDRRTRPNEAASAEGYACLDAAGIAAWLEDVLKSFSRIGEIAAIVPVGHGAAACIVDENGLCVPPVDYEAELPPETRARYLALRDPFALTGSPCLPAGLNLGTQLFWLDEIAPHAMRHGRIVTWAQYWAWLLSGVIATEISSLGTHTDLWVPGENRPSPLAVSRGWAERLAPLRNASDVLSPVRKEWRARCDLPAGCLVYCGVHDSNAALFAARMHKEMDEREFTVLSTGTWFVAMRMIKGKTDRITLPERRDCLVNVDVFGSPVPSARFMGGREVEAIEEPQGDPIDPSAHAGTLLHRAAHAVEAGLFVLPSFQKGVGPFPDRTGHWLSTRPKDPFDRRAVASLYLALMANASLDLIGSAERLIVEGRFAADPVFTRALAALRPTQAVYLSRMQDTVPLGALRLAGAELPQDSALERVEPLDLDLRAYAQRWNELAGQADFPLAAGV